MQFFSVLAAALMPLVALAAPAAEAAPMAPAVGAPMPGAEARAIAESDHLAKRGTPGNVFVCTGPDWQGTCQVFALGISGACLQIPTPYRYNVGSFGPDPGAICRLFDDAHSTCAGSGLAILQHPGSTNLYTPRDFPGFNASYWRCSQCTNCT